MNQKKVVVVIIIIIISFGQYVGLIYWPSLSFIHHGTDSNESKGCPCSWLPDVCHRHGDDVYLVGGSDREQYQYHCNCYLASQIDNNQFWPVWSTSKPGKTSQKRNRFVLETNARLDPHSTPNLLTVVRWLFIHSFIRDPLSLSKIKTTAN